MTADQNSCSDMRHGLNTTAAAAEFVERVTFAALPAEAIRIGTRCLLDGIGLFVAGSEENAVQILAAEAAKVGGRLINQLSV